MAVSPQPHYASMLNAILTYICLCNSGLEYVIQSLEQTLLTLSPHVLDNRLFPSRNDISAETKWGVGVSKAKRIGRENCLFKGPGMRENTEGLREVQYGMKCEWWRRGIVLGRWAEVRSWRIDYAMVRSHRNEKPFMCFKVFIRFLESSQLPIERW